MGQHHQMYGVQKLDAIYLRFFFKKGNIYIYIY